ncbi:MAG: phage tail tape measure protein, partial [Desulfobacteraceae bacterium]|nr:phage tail tape measure protein [Desulfobacteraceae bacterium]
QLQKLMFTMDLMDRVTGPAGKIQQTLGNVADKAQESFSKIAVGGAGVAAAGVALYAMAAPAQEFNMAIGEVRSLDVAQGSLDKLSNKAIEFSVKYGESAKDFVKSSYDIQSAIAGLTGDELSSFTNASNILAKGTKSDAATITNYMGTMYGIFKNSANDMGKAQWVEQLTGQTATAVQMFKTTGTQMAGAFESVGAAATSAGIAQAEQIAILGSLQATMSGSEAGTKYKAFLGGVGQAQEKLGLKFTDAQGNMLGMTDILTKLQGKFGDTFDVAESDALKKAFGSDEAVGMIKLLMADTDGLAANIEKIGSVKGMDKAMSMADSMVDPFQRWSQGINAVRIGLGQALLPTILPVVEGLAEGAGAIYSWTQEFPTLTKWVGYGIVAVVGITGAVATFAVMGGVASMSTLGYANATKFASMAMGGMQKILLITRTSFLWLNAAMYANPIGLVVAGVVALTAGVAAAIYYWDDLKAAFKDIGWIQSIMGWVEKIAGCFKVLGQWIWDLGAILLKIGTIIFLFTTPLGWVITIVGTVIHNWEDLKAAFLDTAWGQAIMGCVNGIVDGFQAFGQYISDTMS